MKCDKILSSGHNDERGGNDDDGGSDNGDS